MCERAGQSGGPTYESKDDGALNGGQDWALVSVSPDFGTPFIKIRLFIKITPIENKSAA